ncbi:flagellar motor protein MotB [Cedecea colo]|uniref:Flagellar motor protein MotB n=1 Tax=Cedecea colo TaxID=2552946 RepID=A0ABX0VNN7_9ENTR|nr:flagellar motor protein MotB [Cedecea colo]NIY48681.1 flagellar motor protein MotB [Cedecea colo]
MSKNGQSLIVVRKKKSHKHGHHGGSWKIAYADFMTAMMAFFLVMWLLATSSPQQRQQIAEYFNMPLKAALSQGNKDSLSDSVIPGGGDDVIKQSGEVFKQTLRKIDREKSVQNLKRALDKLESLIKNDPRLSNYAANLRLSLSDDGLLVQILDTQDRPMFRVGGVRLEPYMVGILQSLAPVLNELPNLISLTGHTDSLPYAGGSAGYSNWELSADRANASRRTLVAAGLSPDKFMRVTGTADIMVLENTQPTDPSNRRISILVLSREKEKSIRREYTSQNIVSAMQQIEQTQAQLKTVASPPGIEQTGSAILNQEKVEQDGRK